MAEFKKNPKWLKHLKQLMNSDSKKAHDELKAALEQLKLKANEFKEKYDAAETDEEREIYLKKLELVNKHRKKGMKRLLGEE